jgi:AmmeMemoRadiSam system protein A
MGTSDSREEGERNLAIAPGDAERFFDLIAGEGDALVDLARRSLQAEIVDKRPLPGGDEISSQWPRLLLPRSAFVTLRKRGALRGCIGTIEPRRPLWEEVVHNAVAAASCDFRFEPVHPDEVPGLDLSVTVLALPQPLEPLAPDALREHLGKTKPGVVLEFRGRRSTFLPQVWESLPDPGDFLCQLCRKQGWPGDTWRDPSVRVQTYGAQHFGAPD